MKRLHLILLIVTMILALLSAYSLAAINQVYKINFSWYSQYQQVYSDAYRETSEDQWGQAHDAAKTEFVVLTSRSQLNLWRSSGNTPKMKLPVLDFSRSVYIYCSLGKVTSPEYRIKILALAQRGNVVEIKVSRNSPAKSDVQGEDAQVSAYYPEDWIKIDKDAFVSLGKLYFIFKNQEGKEISTQYCEVR